MILLKEVKVTFSVKGAILVADEQKNRITTTIYGREYTIVGTESAAHLRQVVRAVDDKMHAISLQNKTLDSGRLAVLTAVNATHDYLLLEKKVRDLEEQLAKYKGLDS
ncbi:cell division protein ZapA [Listeria sp. PSOL-1]|uniref:cell division protein ZapA n=1 Tax=Listeria sp. PSOL-1 TaxID=1844999 RepID=UPI001E4D8BA3|nr:cell division protein ZapA [Listeria sp. PSOL-1]